MASGMFDVDLHLGSVAAINPDATIDIFDYRTGTVMYKHVTVDHTAADIQQPIVGHDVLFFTVVIGAQEVQVKIVRFYGNKFADHDLVYPNGENDIDQGEHKIISNSGAMAYLANGSAYLGSLGQSVTFDDDSQTCTIKCQNLNVITFNGFTIQQTGDTLTIQKGVYDSTLMDVPFPTVTLTITDTEVTIDAPKVTVNNGTQPMIRGGALATWLTNHQHIGNLGAPTTPPIVPPSTTSPIADPTSILSDTEFLE